jgi:hypothetical protein
MTKIGDFFREGAADLFGFGGEIEDLREQAATGKMLARQLESMDWSLLSGSGTTENYFDPPRESREAQVARAYRFFFEDPIVKRSVKLFTNYVLSRGIKQPRYRRDARKGDRDTEADRAADLINRFWNDPENKIALTGHVAQREKNDELQLQGNVFLLLFRQEGAAPVDQQIGILSNGDPQLEPPTLKITDLREREIVEVITHPGNRKVPVWYKRVYVPMEYQFDRATELGIGGYNRSARPVTRYYRDWRFEAPTEWEGRPWGPPPELVAEGRIYHIKVNCTSDMRFGQTEMQAVLKWAQGLNQFMTSRMMVAQALAAIAMQARTRGGTRAVSQASKQLQDISRLAGDVEGTNLRRTQRADQGRTKVAVSNEGVDLRPMVQDTGAAGAMTDTQVMKGQIAAGTGIPIHHLGDVGSANLATATSMDAPLQRMCEDRQELLQTIVLDITGFMLEGERIDPSRLEVEMPPILSKDVGELATMLTTALTAIDPNVSNRKLVRFVFGELLDAMGKQNARDILDEIFPEDFETPYEQQLTLLEKQAELGIQPADGPGGSEQRRSSPAQRSARVMAQGARRADIRANGGRHRGGNRAGGAAAAGAASVARAQQRRQRALREGDDILLEDGATAAGFVQEELLTDEQLAIEAAFAELPEDLRESALAALDPLAALFDDRAVIEGTALGELTEIEQSGGAQRALAAASEQR